MTWLVGQLALAERYVRDPDDPGFDVTCVVTARIGRNGQVTFVDVERCPPAFAESARAAAWQWAFEPWELDGRNQKTEHTEHVRFRSDHQEAWRHVHVVFPGLVDIDLGPAVQLARPTCPTAVAGSTASPRGSSGLR